jgi:hypothetical protein
MPYIGGYDRFDFFRKFAEIFPAQGAPPVSKKLRSEKLPRNRLGTVPLFRGRKCSFQGIPSSAEEPIRKLGTELNGIPRKNEVLRYLHSLSDHSDGLYISLWVVFSSPEWFGTEFRELAYIFVPRNGILSCFIFRWRVWKGLLIVCFYFGSAERNSELFSLPLKGSEGNSESLLLFLFNGTEGFWKEFRELSVPRNSRNSVGNNHLFHLFRLPRNFFLSEIPNLNFTEISHRRQ